MVEKKVIHRWMWVWNFEKEERWLNEMAMQGWVLDKIGFAKYTFKKCEPGEYIVRLELHERDAEYLEFMEEVNAHYIGRMFAWIYFRRKSEEGPFNIFSDIDSKVTHLNKIGRMLSIVIILNLAVGINSIVNPSSYDLGAVNLLMTTVLTYALGRIHGKKESLEMDRFLHE